jgi:inner membrane transporter RhtA
MTDKVVWPIKPMTRERAHMARPVPPEAFFICSAIFHYLGPAFAVLLFTRVDVLGVAWLRIASAAAVFAFWKRPWRLFAELRAGERRIVVALGFVLAIMNVCFYLAINRLPLGTVGTIEFLGPIALAALGVRTMRNLAALLLACSGVFLLTSVRISGEPIGYIFAFANCALFVLYILLGHRIAASGGRGGVERLAMAMVIASIVVTPIGLRSASGALLNPNLLLTGAGVRYLFLRHPVHLRSICNGAIIEDHFCFYAVAVACDGVSRRHSSSATSSIAVRTNRCRRSDSRSRLETKRG